MSNAVKVRMTNIVWDIDDEDNADDIRKQLPKQVTHVFDLPKIDLSADVTDWLSDTYGWCVVSCNVEILHGK